MEQLEKSLFNIMVEKSLTHKNEEGLEVAGGRWGGVRGVSSGPRRSGRGG